MIIDIHTHNFERQGTAPVVEGAKRNGIDKIVAEAQSQLDAWHAAQ